MNEPEYIQFFCEPCQHTFSRHYLNCSHDLASKVWTTYCPKCGRWVGNWELDRESDYCPKCGRLFTITEDFMKVCLYCR